MKNILVKKNLKKFFLLFSIIVFLSLNVKGQKALLTESTLTYDSLTTQQKLKYDSVATFIGHNRIHIIKVGNLDSSTVDGLAKIKLSFLKCSFPFLTTGVDYVSDSNYSYFSNLLDTTTDNYFPSDTTIYTEDSSLIDTSSGFISLAAINGKKYGIVSIGHDSYSIGDIGGVTIMFKMDKPAKSNCGLQEYEASEEDEDVRVRGGGDCQVHRLRILVFFTPAANAWATGMGSTPQAQAILSVQSLQGALNNSLTGGATSIVLAGVQPLNFTEDANQDMDNDLNSFRLNSTVNTQRALSTIHADVVVLLTNGDYGNVNGDAIDASDGVASFKAYAVVQIADAVTAFVFAHEVGHEIGCNHDIDNSAGTAGGTGGYNHGIHMKWKKWNLWMLAYKWYRYRTVMSYSNNSSEVSIPNYSNPNVDYLNHATGSSVENNHQTINDNRMEVTDYYTEDIPFDIHLLVDEPAPCETEARASVDPECGTSPYTQQWYKSTNGVNYSIITGATGSTLTLTFASTNFAHNLYIKVVVTDGASITYTGYEIIHIPACHGWVRLEGNENEMPAEINVYPNPSNGDILISSNQEDGKVSTCQVMDLSGRLLISEIPVLISSQTTELNLKSYNLSSGSYVLRIVQGKQVVSKLINIISE